MSTTENQVTFSGSTDYGQRALVEIAMGPYKAIIGPCLRARSFSGQRVEAAVLNRMLHASRPDSVRRLKIAALDRPEKERPQPSIDPSNNATRHRAAGPICRREP